MCLSQPIATNDPIAWCVSLSVCQFIMHLHPAKMAERTDVRVCKTPGDLRNIRQLHLLLSRFTNQKAESFI